MSEILLIVDAAVASQAQPEGEIESGPQFNFTAAAAAQVRTTLAEMLAAQVAMVY